MNPQEMKKELRSRKAESLQEFVFLRLFLSAHILAYQENAVRNTRMLYMVRSWNKGYDSRISRF